MDVIKVLNVETIKPSQPTSPHLLNFKLSFLDQIAVPLFTPCILFYSIDDVSKNLITHLKETLAKTLTIFYPLAGRARDLVQLECNDKGVLFVEAATNMHLSEYLVKPNIAQLGLFLPTPAGRRVHIGRDDPLAGLQVTKFGCGGLAIGFSSFHRVLDGTSLCHFLQTWAKLTKHSHNVELINPDFASPSLLFPNKDPPPREIMSFFEKLSFMEVEEGGIPIIERFVFDGTAVAKIKAKVCSSEVPNPTKVEALSAFLLKHLILAKKEAKGTWNSCMISHVVNLRNRLKHPLPNAFGNLVWPAYTFYEPSEQGEILPSELVELIREMFSAVDSESIEQLENNGAFNCLLEATNGKENQFGVLDSFKFSSWCRFGVYDIDFGWGKPIWVAPACGQPGGAPIMHGILMLENPEGDGIEAWITQDNEVVAKLMNNTEFLRFASINPRITVV